MKENQIKSIFESLEHEFRSNLRKEVCFEGVRRIDYVADVGGISIGIEAKGSKSNIYNTLGQLLFMKKYFSHLYLLAPLNIIKKVIEVTIETDFLDEIGLITVGDGIVKIIKKPNVEEYYFNQGPLGVPGRMKGQKILTETDNQIIKHFSGRKFSILDIMNELHTTRNKAYSKILRLKRMGYVIVSNEQIYPKSYFLKENNSQ